MAENYTWDAAQEPTRAQLAARVAELEHALAQADGNTVALAERNAALAARLADLEPSGFAMANSALIQRVRQLERENAELLDKLDAVGEYAAYYNSTWWLMFDDPDMTPLAFADWFAQEKQAQPGDTDAPLTLAAIDDEDGDL